MTRLIKPGLSIPMIAVLLVVPLILAGYFYFDKLLNTPVKIDNINIDTKAVLKLNVLKQISKKNGIKEWALNAASATLLKDENKAVLVDVRVIFYTKEGKEVHLESQTGTLDTKAHNMMFSDNVIVVYEAARLRTDRLHYRKKEHIIYSDFPVMLEKQDTVITADSMKTDLNSGTIILKGRVKGKFSENFRLQ